MDQAVADRITRTVVNRPELLATTGRQNDRAGADHRQFAATQIDSHHAGHSPRIRRCSLQQPRDKEIIQDADIALPFAGGVQGRRQTYSATLDKNIARLRLSGETAQRQFTAFIADKLYAVTFHLLHFAGGFRRQRPGQRFIRQLIAAAQRIRQEQFAAILRMQRRLHAASRRQSDARTRHRSLVEQKHPAAGFCRGQRRPQTGCAAADYQYFGFQSDRAHPHPSCGWEKSTTRSRTTRYFEWGSSVTVSPGCTIVTQPSASRPLTRTRQEPHCPLKQVEVRQANVSSSA